LTGRFYSVKMSGPMAGKRQRCRIANAGKGDWVKADQTGRSTKTKK